MGIFERFLSVWVGLAMVAGVLLGLALPQGFQAVARLEVAHVNLPVAVLIWLMIYPMMLKVDFQSIKNVGKNPKGLFVTWITNWLIIMVPLSRPPRENLS